MMTCPKCGEVQYPVCDNPDCVCRRSIPEGAKPMEWVDGENQRCPYCGFTAPASFWETEDIEEFLASNGVSSFSELKRRGWV